MTDLPYRCGIVVVEDWSALRAFLSNLGDRNEDAQFFAHVLHIHPTDVQRDIQSLRTCTWRSGGAAPPPLAPQNSGEQRGQEKGEPGEAQKKEKITAVFLIHFLHTTIQL